MTRTSIVRHYPRRQSLVNQGTHLADMDSLFNEFVRPGALFGRWVGEGLRDSWVPAVDVQETEKAFVFTAELPGLGKDDVEITLEENLLTLSGARELKEIEEGETYHRIERAYGSFSRSFSLPSQVDSSGIAAAFENGILKVSVPKSEQAQPRKIQIK